VPELLCVAGASQSKVGYMQMAATTTQCVVSTRAVKVDVLCSFSCMTAAV
jgi:hypothetical protein